MSTPTASTKSVNSTSPEAQNATSKDISSSSPQRTSTTHSTSNSQQQQPTNGDATTTANGTEAGQGGEGEQGGEGGGAEGLDEEGYPPQKHAGAIGLGPEYGKMREATASDKIAGLKDELVGKVTRNQDKVQHGHEQRTGELKRKKFEEESSADPFNAADSSNKDSAPAQNTTTGSGNTEGNTTNSGSSSIPGNQAPTSVTGKRGAGTHPTEAGAQEQAATTAPEGTEEAERQRSGGNVDEERVVDEGEEGREVKKLRAE